MVDAGSIWVYLRLNADELRAGLDKAKYNLTEWRDETNKSSMEMAKWGAAISRTVAPWIAVGLAIKETINAAELYQDQIEDMHNTLGVSITDAQKWRAATIATDTDMGSFSTTLRWLTQRVTDQSEAGESLRATLRGIGVDAKDANGNWKDGSVLMQEVLVALNKIPEGSQRAGVASEILGRNWYTMAEMIANADTAVKTFEEAHAGMTDAESDRTEKFKIKWAQLAEKIELAKVDVGLFFIDMDEKATSFDQAHPGIMGSQWWKNTFDKTGAATAGAGGRRGGPTPSSEMVVTALTGTNAAGLDITISQMKAGTISIYDLSKAVADGRITWGQYLTVLASVSETTEEAANKQKALKDATDDLASAETKLADINKDYSRDLTVLNPRDVAGARSLYLRHQFDVEDQSSVINAAQAKVGAAANAVKYGDVIVNVDGKTIAKVPGVAAGGLTPDNLAARGVRTA